MMNVTPKGMKQQELIKLLKKHDKERKKSTFWTENDWERQADELLEQQYGEEDFEEFALYRIRTLNGYLKKWYGADTPPPELAFLIDEVDDWLRNRLKQ